MLYHVESLCRQSWECHAYSPLRGFILREKKSEHCVSQNDESLPWRIQNNYARPQRQQSTWEEKCYPSHLRLLKGLILNSSASIKLQWKKAVLQFASVLNWFCLRVQNSHWVKLTMTPHHIKVTKMSLHTILRCFSCWEGKSFKLDQTKNSLGLFNHQLQWPNNKQNN